MSGQAGVREVFILLLEREKEIFLDKADRIIFWVSTVHASSLQLYKEAKNEDLMRDSEDTQIFYECSTSPILSVIQIDLNVSHKHKIKTHMIQLHSACSQQF